MSDDYGNKDEAIRDASAACENAIQRHNLHPTDKAEAYREIQRQAGEAAAGQEERNAENGVPERPEDQEKTAISERMDGGR